MAQRGRVAGVVVAVLLAPAVLGAQAERPGVRLAEAVRLAEQVQPSMVQARTGVDNAQARLRATTGAFLPNLSISSSGSSSFSQGPSRVDPTGQVITGDATTSSVGTTISSSIDLFTGFRRGADRRAAISQHTAADATLRNASFQQKLATTTQFYDALAAEQLLQVREASVRRAEQQLNVAINRLQAGAATLSDSLRSLVTLGQARLQLITAETQLANAEANLGRLIGREGRVRALADSSLFQQVPPVLDTAGLRQEALENAPTVQVATANTHAAQALLSVAKAAYWPSLNLGGSNSFNASGRNDYQVFQSRSISLSLSWQVFNRFSREQNIQLQLSSLDVAEANQGEARRQVMANLTVRLAELQSAALRLEITQTSVVAATEDLRVQQERYRLGLATIVDILTAQEALNQAEVDGVNARFDYLRAKAQIEALIGRDL